MTVLRLPAENVTSALESVWNAATDAATSPDFDGDDDARGRYRLRIMSEARTRLTDGGPEPTAVREWSALAYELWALACNSTTNGHASEEEWNAARNRLGERFHKALDDIAP